jgi:hypothetical protein
MADIKDHVSVIRNNQDLLPGGEGEDFWPPHGWTHEDGNYDEISIAGLSGVTGDMQDAQWLRGIEIEDSLPLDGEVLVYNDTAGEWQFQPVSGLGIHWSRNTISEYLYPTSVDDTIQVGDGDASQVAYGFASSINSGMWYDDSDNTIHFSLGGIDRFKIEDRFGVTTALQSVENARYYWEILHQRSSGNTPHLYISSIAAGTVSGADITVKADTPAGKVAKSFMGADGGSSIAATANGDASEIYLSADETIFYDEFKNNTLFGVSYSAGALIDSYQEYFIIQNQHLGTGEDGTIWLYNNVDDNGNIFIENVTDSGTAYSLYKTASTDGSASAVLSAASTNSTASVDITCDSSTGYTQIALDDEIYFDDSYRPGSTWTDANGVPLAESIAEWTNARTILGADASILAMLYAAANSGGSLDDAYDFGGAGGGRQINVDSGPVRFTGQGSYTDIVAQFENTNSANTAEVLQLYNGATLSTGKTIEFTGPTGGSDSDDDEMGHKLWSQGSVTMGHSAGSGATLKQSYTSYQYSGSGTYDWSTLLLQSDWNSSTYYAWIKIQAGLNDGADYGRIEMDASNHIKINPTTYLQLVTDTGDILIDANSDIEFTDGNTSGSTWVQGHIKLSDATTGWDAYDNLYGEIGIIEGIVESLQLSMTDIGSVGYISGGSITDAGSQQFNVAAGVGCIRSTDSDTGDNAKFSWSASTGNSIPDGAIRYVFVDYNSGSPIVNVKTAFSNNGHTEFYLGDVVREGTTLHIQNNPDTIANPITKLNERLRHLGPAHVEGLSLGETGTRYVTVTAGEIYYKLNEFEIAAIDTSGADTFDSYLGATLDTAGVSQWDNQNYNNGGTKTALTANRYGCLWFYQETDGDLVMLYGTSNATTVVGAQAESAPSTVPPRITAHGFLIGRIVFQQGASTASIIESAFGNGFTSSPVSDHNSLSGLQGGTSGEYYHLTAAEYNTLGSYGDDATLWFGDSDDVGIEWNTDQTNDALLIGVSGSETIIICEKADLSNDFGLSARTNPTLVLYDGGAASWLEIYSDATSSQIYSNNILTLNAGTEISVAADLDIGTNEIQSGAIRLLQYTGGKLYVGDDFTNPTATVDIEASSEIEFSISNLTRAEINSAGLEMNNYDIYEAKTITFNSVPTVTPSAGTATCAFDDYQKIIVNLNNVSSVTVQLNTPRAAGNFMLVLLQGSTTASTVTWATEGTHAFWGSVSVASGTSERTMIGLFYDGSTWYGGSNQATQILAS